MPKIPEEQKVRRRKQIMQAALVCAARKGFHQTSMRDICREANLSIGAVYNYYKSKEEILAAITKEGRQAKQVMWKSVNECQNGKESFRELFRHIFLAYKNEAFNTYGSIDLETYCEATRNEEIRRIMLEEYEALTNPLIKIVRKWQEKKEIREDVDPRYLAYYLIALSVGIKIHLLVQPVLTVTEFEQVWNKTFLDGVWTRINTDGSE
jgi:AcrR family transcriptional regulator